MMSVEQEIHQIETHPPVVETPVAVEMSAGEGGVEAEPQAEIIQTTDESMEKLVGH